VPVPPPLQRNYAVFVNPAPGAQRLYTDLIFDSESDQLIGEARAFSDTPDVIKCPVSGPFSFDPNYVPVRLTGETVKVNMKLVNGLTSGIADYSYRESPDQPWIAVDG
jgi:hypothetical protein